MYVYYQFSTKFFLCYFVASTHPQTNFVSPSWCRPSQTNNCIIVRKAQCSSVKWYSIEKRVMPENASDCDYDDNDNEAFVCFHQICRYITFLICNFIYKPCFITVFLPVFKTILKRAAWAFRCGNL